MDMLNSFTLSIAFTKATKMFFLSGSYMSFACYIFHPTFQNHDDNEAVNLGLVVGEAKADIGTVRLLALPCCSVGFSPSFIFLCIPRGTHLLSNRQYLEKERPDSRSQSQS